MRRTLGVMAGATVAVALLSGGAFAARDGTYKDEKSSGSGYGKETDARCDVSSLTAEKGKRSLLVSVALRGGQADGVRVTLNLNTQGGLRSDPEFTVSGEGSLTKTNGLDEHGFPVRPEQAGFGGVTTAKRGKLVRFRIPLKPLGKAKQLGVQARTCGEGAVDVAPGRHYFGDTSSDGTIAYQYLKPDRADRVIEGRVIVRCAGTKSCSRLPVKDAVVTAKGRGRALRIATDDQGRYELAVEKGVYSVTAKAGQLGIAPKAKRVDLTKRRSARADFTACGVGGRKGGSARASAVGGGTWRGGNRDCLNYLEISWRPSAASLSISWISAPICTAVGGNYVGTPKLLMRGRLIDPSKQGENLSVTAGEVGFFYPIVSVHTGNNVNGKLLANRSGSVNARYAEGLCTYAISDLKLKG